MSDRRSIDEAPYEIAYPIREFFPQEEWDNATSIAWLESGWSPFVVNNTVTPCHSLWNPHYARNGVVVSAERSVGVFQINACNFPTWEWQRLYNARHNVATARVLFACRGWQPRQFSARRLGLLE